MHFKRYHPLFSGLKHLKPIPQSAMSFAKMVKTVKKNFNNIKILVLGLDNAGKTTILSRYMGESVVSAPTFGYKILTKREDGCTLNILDVGGQTLFKKYWSNYFESVDGIVFVIDCSDARPVAGYLAEISELDVPVALFCNKYDLNPTFQLEAEIPLPCFRCFMTSAVQNTGIAEGFDWIIGESVTRL